MPKKKNKKVSKTKSKEIKGQLGKKKATDREKMIGQSIGYRYDVNLLPDYSLSLIHISEPTRRTPISYAVFCLKKKRK